MARATNPDPSLTFNDDDVIERLDKYIEFVAQVNMAPKQPRKRKRKQRSDR